MAAGHADARADASSYRRGPTRSGGFRSSLQGSVTWTTAQPVAEFADDLGLEEFTFIGHDVGAWVGCGLACRRTERVSALGLIDGNIAGVNLELNAETRWNAWHFVFNRVPELPEALLEGKERVLIEWFFERSAADPTATFTSQDIDEHVRAFARPTTLRGLPGPLLCGAGE